MTSKNLTILPTSSPALPVFPLGRDQYIELASEWFGLDVANGDAREDTINAYMSHIRHWLTWCQANQVDPARPTVEHVKMFRRELVKAKLAHSTISLKLTSVRRFYEGALQRNLIDYNPAKNVRPPKQREATEEDLVLFETEEVNELFRVVPNDDKLRSLRDRAMIALMTIGGLRRVEVCRANVQDIHVKAVSKRSRHRMLVHGKGKDRYKFLRDDVAAAINKYLENRINKGPVQHDNDGEPLFVSLSKSEKPLSRITRDGLSRVLNAYLVKAGLRKLLERGSEKQSRQRSCHALRHTYGTAIWRDKKDLKIVQEELGHTTVNMAARYSHVDSKSKDRHADDIPIDIGG